MNTANKLAGPFSSTRASLMVGKPAPADKLMNSRRRSPHTNRNRMRCQKIIPNEHGTSRDWRFIAVKSIGVGANMSSAIGPWLTWPVMSCCCCARSMGGRWRNYRNNSTIRGEIWKLLRYKCHLLGLRFHTEYPRGTSHACPRCGSPAKTYVDPSDRTKAVQWGRWMICETCHYNGDRDYCASVNIARLGVAYLVHMKHTGKARSCAITDPRVKPVSYTGTGAVLPLPPPGKHPARKVRGKICYIPGWLDSVYLQSSQKKPVFLRLRR